MFHHLRGSGGLYQAASPRFKAVDEAIKEEGWKVVFLLRL